MQFSNHHSKFSFSTCFAIKLNTVDYSVLYSDVTTGREKIKRKDSNYREKEKQLKSCKGQTCIVLYYISLIFQGVIAAKLEYHSRHPAWCWVCFATLG